MIHAISLDLWKTLIVDKGEDEALRDRIRARAIFEVLSDKGVAASEDSLYESLRHIDVLRRDVREMRDWTLTTANQVRFVLTQATVYPSRELVDAILPRYESAILDLMPTLLEPEAPQLLQMLAASHPLSLTSNTGKTPGRVLLDVLDTLNIRKPFSHFIFSDEAMFLKPDAGIWNLLVDANGVKPDAIVHIGDSFSMDYKGARAAGLEAVLFGRRPSLPQDIRVIDSLAELPAIIQEMNT
ncbi:MAG: HAD family hydrolase [Candidatus Cryosericum sp.]